MSHPPADSSLNYRGAGHRVPVQLQASLAVAVARLGLPRVAKIVGVGQTTILRALAGGGCRHSTIFLISARLPALEREVQQSPAAPESAPPPPPPKAR